MSVYAGPADWWTDGTDAGRTHIATKGIVQSGLVLNLDAGVSSSYPGTGTTWTDLSGNGNNFTISGTLTHNSSGYFDFGGGHIYNNVSMPTTSTICTCVFWIKTTDTVSLFWSLYNNTSKFLGAYRVGNKYYNGSAGTPTYFQDTVSKSNIYDNLIDGNWHMVEFKGVDFSTWTSLAFSQYTSYIFDAGSIAAIWIYNRTLTSTESQQNFNALRGRFGI